MSVEHGAEIEYPKVEIGPKPESRLGCRKLLNPTVTLNRLLEKMIKELLPDHPMVQMHKNAKGNGHAPEYNNEIGREFVLEYDEDDNIL